RSGVAPSEPAEHSALRPRRSRSVAAPRSPLARGCSAMNALSGHVEDYLRLRRALGFKLEQEGRWLTQFVSYVEASGEGILTGGVAIKWAQQPVTAHPNLWAKRLGVVRKFAAYLHTIEPATEVPPTNVFAARRRRPTPYLWSESDIARLIE